MSPEMSALNQAESFERLVRSERKNIYGLCYRYCGNHADAEDLTQEAFTRAFRGLSNFRGDSSFSTWMYRIAVNVCLNWVSSRKAITFELTDDVVDAKPTPVEQASKSETRSTVREAVSQLPEKQRMALVLRVYEELPHKEIAKIMECSVSTSKTHFFFALKNLKRKLAVATQTSGEGA